MLSTPLQQQGEDMKSVNTNLHMKIPTKLKELAKKEAKKEMLTLTQWVNRAILEKLG